MATYKYDYSIGLDMEFPFKPKYKVNWPVLAITAASIFISIGLLSYMDQNLDNIYVITSFGATAVLIYGAPKAPFSRPKNVFFGHLFSALIGVAVAWTFNELGLYDDLKWFAVGFGVMLAIVVMLLTDTTHPPGGATALACVYSGFFGLEYVFRPFMFGICIMLAIAFVANWLKAKFEKEGNR